VSKSIWFFAAGVVFLVGGLAYMMQTGQERRRKKRHKAEFTAWDTDQKLNKDIYEAEKLAYARGDDAEARRVYALRRKSTK